ncbi:uncharacterized protein LOC124860709 isoform X1 [Girardinichthys multiradiatus]|uniref:uncharacterized protein LOC124860709 isoform X1 n=1 Tax=Girardinichthys multiradiatus TaxID=208333 RepID=UPI001FAD2435|nr:uncharacterized protein LOC124860709 isoform X1 [Girardinichthys multiradiatus]
MLLYLDFSMMAFQVLLGGVPVKGSVPQHQSSSGTNAGGNVASYRRVSAGHTVPVSHSAPAGVLKQDPRPSQFLQSELVFVGVSSMPEAGHTTNAGSVPVQAAHVGSYIPVPVGYYGAGSYMPGYDAGSQQAGAAQPPVPEAKWTIAPQSFEEASTNTQAQDPGALLPPPGPALQSGETSNVVKEAELGNYQQQTEYFGYPVDHMGPGQGFPLATQSLGVGGLWGYPSPYPLPYPFPYPDFDYRLLYGLYPPGTYTTFSREHEKGTDYFQDIHYLKEYGSNAPQTPQHPGSGQQKVFPGTT